MDIQKFSNTDIQKDENMLQSVWDLIKQSFDEISDQYQEWSEFKKEVQAIENTIKNADKTNVFYIIKDNQDKLLWCLWWTENENFFFNDELWSWNAFYSKFVGVDKGQKRIWVWTLLKNNFEKEAQKKATENQKVSVVMSRVSKKNNNSIAWNLKNWYEQYDEGDDSMYYQFYKKFKPNDTYDKIQPWTLEVDKDQYHAMIKTQEIWKDLSKKREQELLDLRKSWLTNKQIANRILPQLFEIYPWVAEVSISYALWLILWEKREELTNKIISELWKNPENIERLKQISKKWIKARVEKYWDEEVFKQRRDWWKKAAEWQWKKVFSEEEKDFVIELCNNKKYKNKFWKIKRSEISQEVNKKFRNWESVRNWTAIADCYRRYK